MRTLDKILKFWNQLISLVMKLIRQFWISLLRLLLFSRSFKVHQLSTLRIISWNWVLSRLVVQLCYFVSKELSVVTLYVFWSLLWLAHSISQSLVINTDAAWVRQKHVFWMIRKFDPVHKSHFLNCVIKYDCFSGWSSIRLFWQKGVNHLRKILWKDRRNSLELRFQNFLTQFLFIWTNKGFR